MPLLSIVDRVLTTSLAQDVGRFKSVRDLQTGIGLDLEVVVADVYRLLGWTVVPRGGLVLDGGVGPSSSPLVERFAGLQQAFTTESGLATQAPMRASCAVARGAGSVGGITARRPRSTALLT